MLDSIFVGRQREMDRMVELWDCVKKGQGPTLCLLEGDAGFGKTQLVQEFYARVVSADQEGDSYWPRQLNRSGLNLELNPDVDEMNGIVEPAPFLWWGFRLHNPHERNGRSGSLSQVELNLLRTHTRFATNAVETWAVVRKSCKKILVSLVKSAPLVGPVVEVLEQISEVTEHLGEHARMSGKRNIDAPGDTEMRKREFVDEVINTLAEFFSHQKTKPLPTIIVIDDAHWLQSELVEHDVLDRLLAKSYDERWPCLFVVTTWPTGGECFGGLAKKFAGAQETIKVDRLAEADQLICNEFPSLPKSDVDFLCARADGNPLLTMEIILLLQEDPGLLIDGRTSSGLSQYGRREIFSEETFSFDKIVEQRFKRAGHDIGYAVGLCSLQGIRFLDEIGEELEREMGGTMARVLTDASFKPTLDKAADPLGLIARSKDGILGFSHSAYRVQAGKRLSRITGRKDEELRSALKRCLKNAAKKYGKTFDLEKKRLLAEIGMTAFTKPENAEEANAMLNYIRLKLDVLSEDIDDFHEIGTCELGDWIIQNWDFIKANPSVVLTAVDIQDILDGMPLLYPGKASLIRIYIEQERDSCLGWLADYKSSQEHIASDMVRRATEFSADDWDKYKDLLFGTSDIRNKIVGMGTYEKRARSHGDLLEGNTHDRIQLESDIAVLLDMNDEWIQDPCIGERTDFIKILQSRRHTACLFEWRSDKIFDQNILMHIFQREFDNIVELGFNARNSLADEDRVRYAKTFLNNMIVFLESGCPVGHEPDCIPDCNDPMIGVDFKEMIESFNITWNHM